MNIFFFFQFCFDKINLKIYLENYKQSDISILKMLIEKSKKIYILYLLINYIKYYDLLLFQKKKI